MMKGAAVVDIAVLVVRGINDVLGINGGKRE
jgi:hypothetical protein